MKARVSVSKLTVGMFVVAEVRYMLKDKVLRHFLELTDADGQVLKPQPSPKAWTPGTMHIHDLNATILHLLGIDHTKLTYRYQGRDFRLTDVHGHVVHDILA